MENNNDFNSNYPSIAHLKKKASKKIPRFAFEYLSGGANEEVNMARNKSDIQEVVLQAEYLKNLKKPDLTTTLFSKTYAAPFGIAPVGLQGLIWPNSPEILAKAAHTYNIPFVLSTVTTASIERTAEITEGDFWFQLYHPAEDQLRDQLLKRAWDAGCRVLVLLADTPSFGIRYKDIRNGLSMPPTVSARNIVQIMGKPEWALRTLYHGQPAFEILKPYMPKNLNLSQLGKFMNDTFDGRLTENKIAEIRKSWKGKLVIKGIVNKLDAAKAVKLGADGIIVSNHGGRQHDAGPSAIASLKSLAAKFNQELTIMMDGGIRSGPDIARCLAAGADFVFMGRPFMYGVAALGAKGGNHTISLFKKELFQVMDQIGCDTPEDFTKKLMNY